MLKDLYQTENVKNKQLENSILIITDNNLCFLFKSFLNDSFKHISERVNKFIDKYYFFNIIHVFIFDFYKYFESSSDLKQLKEQRKQFDKISVELENALVKHSDSPKTKPLQCEEAERSLCGIRKSYGHCSLNYVTHLNKFYLTRSHSVLDIVQLFSQSIKTFYQCGNHLVDEHDSELGDISTNLCRMSEVEKKSIENMENQHDSLRSQVGIILFYCILILKTTFREIKKLI